MKAKTALCDCGVRKSPRLPLHRSQSSRVSERLDALRRDVGLDEQAWLNFMIALVHRHRRFDIEVEVAERLQIGEFDIEIKG